MKFKETDSNELQATLAILVVLVMLIIPACYTLELVGILPYFWINSAEVVVTMGAAFMCIFCVMYLKLRENRKFTYFDLFWFLLLSSYIFSTIFAQDTQLAIAGRDFSYEGTIINVGYLVILYSCSLIKEPKYRKWVYVGVTIFGLYEVFVAFMQTVVQSELFLGGMEIVDDIVNAFGTMTNQNPFACIMCMLSGLEYGLIYCSKNKKKKIFHGVLGILYTICLFFSGNRGGILGLGASALIFAIIVLKSAKNEKVDTKKIFKGLGIVIGCVIVAFVVALLLNKSAAISAIGKFQTAAETSEETNADTSTTLNTVSSGRLGIWEAALKKYVFSYPVFGVGVSNFILMKYSGYTIAEVYTAHNDYIDILCSQGIYGLVMYLLLEIYIFVTAIKKMKRDGIKNSHELLGLLMGYTAYMIAAFFEWRIIYMTPYFYILTGMLFNRIESSKVKLKRK